MNPCFQAIRCVWGAWVLYWMAAAFGTKRTVRRESLGSMLGQRVFLLPAYALLLVLPASSFGLGRRWLGAPWAFPGLVLCAAGLGFAVWARRHLGANWSGVVTLKQGHQLIRSGPYAFSRHPIYTGILAASLGAAMARGTLGAALGFVLALAAFQIKMGMEERFMREEFGKRYDDYSAKVKKLVPYLY